MSVESRVSVIGTRGSGKTTVLGFMNLTAIDLALKEKRFKATIVEPPPEVFPHPKQGLVPPVYSAGFRDVPSALCEGKFPPSTSPDKIFEADLVLEWDHVLGKKKISLPFVETAGETIQTMIQRFSQGLYDITDLPGSKEIHDYILKSDGFVIVTPVSRALRLACGQDQSLDVEPESLSDDPDVNVARFLDAIFSFKNNNPDSPRIKGIAFVLTKCDVAKYYLAGQGMNLDLEKGIQKFLDEYYPQTMASIGMFGIDKVRFFYSDVELAMDAEGNPVKDDKNRVMIKIDTQKRRPKYSRPQYEKLIDWLKQTFTESSRLGFDLKGKK